MMIGCWAKMGSIPSVGGWLVWSVVEDWPLELWSAKCVLWRRLKYENGHEVCYLESDGHINVRGAQTGVALLSKYCVNQRATDTWVLQWNLKRILVISSCGLARKEKVVKAVEPNADQRVGRIGEWGWGGVVKAWMVYVLAASKGLSYGILMLLLGYEGMSSHQLRWLVYETWTGQKDMSVCQQTNWDLDCSCTPR